MRCLICMDAQNRLPDTPDDFHVPVEQAPPPSARKVWDNGRGAAREGFVREKVCPMRDFHERCVISSRPLCPLFRMSSVVKDVEENVLFAQKRLQVRNAFPQVYHSQVKYGAIPENH